MTSLLVLKEQMREIYSRYGNYLRPIGKLLTAFAVFMLVNGRLGFDERLSELPVALILAVICAVLPFGAITVFAGILAAGQVFSVSPVIAAVILVIYVIMYCMAVRYSKEMVNVILAIPILYPFHMAYAVPILLGLIATPAAVLPTACGVVTYYLFYEVKKSAAITVGTSMEDSLSLYKQLFDSLFANREMLFWVILFVAALLVTYLLRKRDADHAFETANLAGTLVCVIGSLLGKLVFDISGNMFVLILGCLFSGAVVYVIWHFRMILDYSAAEQLQFEDDDYYYYVKAVPKLKMTAPEKNVKRINPQKLSENAGMGNDGIDRMDMED